MALKVDFKFNKNEIIVTNQGSSFKLFYFQSPNQNCALYDFSDNYLSPYDSNILYNRLNNFKFDLERDFKNPDKVDQQKNFSQFDGTPSSENVPETRFDGDKIEQEIVLINFDNSKFKDFKNDNDGGCVFAQNVRVSCVDTEFRGCQSKSRGGAMYLRSTNYDNCKLNLKNIKFTNCKAACGGAVYIYSKVKRAKILVDSCTFTGNEATEIGAGPNRGGGAIFIASKYGSLNNNVFVKNIGGNIKVTSDLNSNLKILSDSLNKIEINKCDFIVDKDSESPIYFIDGSNGDCLVHVAKGQKYVDGQLNSQNSHRIHLMNCKFQYNTVNYDVVDLRPSGFLNEKIMDVTFLGFCIVASVTFIAFLIIRFKKSNDKINEKDDSSDEKTVINESL